MNATQKLNLTGRLTVVRQKVTAAGTQVADALEQKFTVEPMRFTAAAREAYELLSEARRVAEEIDLPKADDMRLRHWLTVAAENSLKASDRVRPLLTPDLALHTAQDAIGRAVGIVEDYS